MERNWCDVVCFETSEHEHCRWGFLLAKYKGKTHKFTDLKTIYKRCCIDESFLRGTGVVVGASQLKFGWNRRALGDCPRAFAAGHSFCYLELRWKVPI